MGKNVHVYGYGDGTSRNDSVVVPDKQTIRRSVLHRTDTRLPIQILLLTLV